MKLENDGNIWVYAEHRQGRLIPVFWELLVKAKELANNIEGCKVVALVIGSAVESVVKEAAECGADILYYVDDSQLLHYNCERYAALVEKIIIEHSPLAFLFGGSAIGAELAPTLAVRVKVGVAAHCIDITTNRAGELTFIVPAFGGKLEGEISMPRCRPQMATVNPGAFEACRLPKEGGVQVVQLPCPALPDSRIAFVASAPANGEGVQRLAESELVIGCGRGVGGQENFRDVKRLAKKLGAEIAFTRPAIDMGWASDQNSMVGSSGKSIAPKLYLGLGISGAVHHTSGISKSGTIISVNKDARAKIFEVSDYKAVADCKAVVSAMLKALD